MSYVASVSHTEDFDVPAAAVWQLLLDWGALGEWMPGGLIRSLRLEGQGVGAIRHIVTGKGVALSERLDAVNEPAGTLELSLVGALPWGLLSYRARGQVLGLSPNSCRLTWRGILETPESGIQAEQVAHLLGRSYANMFLGVRQATARRLRHSS